MIIETILGVFILTVMILFVYVGMHIQEESRQDKSLPMIWEEGGLLHKTTRKVFDKSDIKYRDGDNT